VIKPQTSLGKELRRLREDRKISVRTLATRLGFSASFISQVERGQASPSIASLERIAETLGVGLHDLFVTVGLSSVVPVRPPDRPIINSEWSKARMEALTGTHSHIPMEAMLVHLLPGGASGKKLHSTPHPRFGFVLRGTITLFVGERTYQMKAGDAVTVPGGQLHRWTNATRRVASIVIVTSRPVWIAPQSLAGTSRLDGWFLRGFKGPRDDGYPKYTSKSKTLHRVSRGWETL
jgi:transcriptional regulator with XRE-family HTH domain